MPGRKDLRSVCVTPGTEGKEGEADAEMSPRRGTTSYNCCTLQCRCHEQAGEECLACVWVRPHGRGYQPGPTSQPPALRNKVSLAGAIVCAGIRQESTASSPTVFHNSPLVFWEISTSPHIASGSFSLQRVFSTILRHLTHSGSTSEQTGEHTTSVHQACHQTLLHKPRGL